ncbi:MAG: four helix bundle protein [Aureibaculum sp.]|nr:four helix bundle protein [Aureibaculum sp.]
MCQIQNLIKHLSNANNGDSKTRIPGHASIPSNIAEGMEKESIKEQARLLEISQGSAAEISTQTNNGIEAG